MPCAVGVGLGARRETCRFPLPASRFALLDEYVQYVAEGTGTWDSNGQNRTARRRTRAVAHGKGSSWDRVAQQFEAPGRGRAAQP